MKPKLLQDRRRPFRIVDDHPHGAVFRGAGGEEGLGRDVFLVEDVRQTGKGSRHVAQEDGDLLDCHYIDSSKYSKPAVKALWFTSMIDLFLLPMTSSMTAQVDIGRHKTGHLQKSAHHHRVDGAKISQFFRDLRSGDLEDPDVVAGRIDGDDGGV